MAGNFHKIDPAIKAEILRQVKEDLLPIIQVATKYSVSTKTIYNWLRAEVDSTGVSPTGIAGCSLHGAGRSDADYLTDIHKLQRERDELIQIVGAFSIVVERLKKKDEEDRFNQKYPRGRKK